MSTRTRRPAGGEPELSMDYVPLIWKKKRKILFVTEADEMVALQAEITGQRRRFFLRRFYAEEVQESRGQRRGKKQKGADKMIYSRSTLVQRNETSAGRSLCN